MAVVGGLAITKMSLAKRDSLVMSKQYTPAVTKFADLSEHFDAAMLSMRSYGISEKESYYTETSHAFKKINEDMRSIQELVDRSEKLVKTREALPLIKEDIAKFDEMADETHAMIEKRIALRQNLDDSFRNYDDALATILNSSKLKLRNESKAGLENQMVVLELLDEIKDAVTGIRVSIWKFQSTRDWDNVSGLEGSIKEAHQKFAALAKVLAHGEEQKSWQASMDAAQKYFEVAQTLLKNYREMDELGKKRLDVQLMAKERMSQTMVASLNKTQLAADDNANDLGTAALSVILGLTLALILGITLAVFLSRSITKPVQIVAQALGQVAQGDLTVSAEVDSQDEIGDMARALNQTIVELSRVMGEIRTAADQTAASGEELSAAAQNISQGAQKQSSALQSIATAVEELNASIQKVSENAQVANHVSQDTTQIANKGSAVVKKSVEGMGLINESSSQINKIIAVIGQIANQTNLLALNAAIEAASAGEHGMGFAVVAEEVRKLAERSSSAAEEITHLIEESSRRVSEGSKLSLDLGSALEEILSGVTKTSGGVMQISSSTEEQATTATDVARSVQNISGITLENTSSAEEMAASAEELSAQAQRLQGLVERFRVNGDMEKLPLPPTPSKAKKPETQNPFPAHEMQVSLKSKDGNTSGVLYHD